MQKKRNYYTYWWKTCHKAKYRTQSIEHGTAMNITTFGFPFTVAYNTSLWCTHFTTLYTKRYYTTAHILLSQYSSSHKHDDYNVTRLKNFHSIGIQFCLGFLLGIHCFCPFSFQIMYSRPTPSAYVNPILFSLILLTVELVDAFCPQHYWWHQDRNACIECTACDENSIVLRPCQPHQDTICGTLDDLELEIDWLAAHRAQQVRITLVRFDWTLLNEICFQLYRSD